MARQKQNPKRRLVSSIPDQAELDELAAKVAYNGSPYHKRNPGDFGLTPPSSPRFEKTLCDPTEVTKKELATKLLREGISRGLISENTVNGFPKNVWSVHKGWVLESQLENETKGEYHGYPLTEDDPLHAMVKSRWEES